ncbi:MAG TPA: hypothetical protein ENN61_01660 [Bacteroidaceae bacterium]|nr:hypothetical protein [Bacteroidaceae bacterium]
MKDTLITSKIKKREIVVFIICFVAAYILNVVGIIYYKSPAIELVTQLHVVLILAIIFYLAIIILRVLYLLLSRLWFLIKK